MLVVCRFSIFVHLKKSIYSVKDEVFHSVNTEVNKLVRTILTLPALSCTVERSFSGLRRLKFYRHECLERLNAVANNKRTLR